MTFSKIFLLSVQQRCFCVKSSQFLLGTSQLLVDCVRISCRDCSWRLQYTRAGCKILTNPFLPLMLRGFMWDMWLKYQLLISCVHGVVRSYQSRNALLKNRLESPVTSNWHMIRGARGVMNDINADPPLAANVFHRYSLIFHGSPAFLSPRTVGSFPPPVRVGANGRLKADITMSGDCYLVPTSSLLFQTLPQQLQSLNLCLPRLVISKWGGLWFQHVSAFSHA